METKTVVLCAVEGCPTPRRKFDWCGRHYAHWRRRGDVNAPMAWEWREPGLPCVACGSIVESRSRYCSDACQVAISRSQLGRPELVESVACIECGDAIDVSRQNGKRTARVTTQMCRDCKAQRQKHKVSAKVLVRRDGDACQWCGLAVDLAIEAPDQMSASIDRIIPRSRGGTNALSNLQLAHRGCNQAKGDLLPHELLVTHCTEVGCTRKLANRAMGLCYLHMRPYYRTGTVPEEMRGHKAYRRLAS